MFRFTLFATILFLCACGSPPSPVERDDISLNLDQRLGTNGALRQESADLIPAGVQLTDGLNLEESVALALTNNPEFQLALTRLDISQAELEQAGLMKNPILSLLLPIGPKQLEATIFAPIISLLTRPYRVAAATLDIESVSMDLVQNGLRVAQDVELVLIDIQLAKDRLHLLRASNDILRRQAEIAKRQYEAGDIPRSALLENELALARQGQAALEEESTLAQAFIRYRNVLGVDVIDSPRHIAAMDLGRYGQPIKKSKNELAEYAFASRPDRRAAEIAIEREQERIGLAKVDFERLNLIADANEEGFSGFEAGPGFEIELPIFDQGQGRVRKAEAQLLRSMIKLRLVDRRIRLGIDREHGELTRLQNLARRQNSTNVRAAQTIDRTTEKEVAAGIKSKADALGSKLIVLQEQNKLLNYQADCARAKARLQYQVGSRLELLD